MIVKEYESREEWLKGREGKIGGSSSFDVYSIKEPTVDDIKKVLDAQEIVYKKSGSKAELLSLVPEECLNDLEAKVQKKMGYYQLMAERLAVKEEGPDNETPLERGTRLEPEAVEKFATMSKKEVENNLILWISDAHPAITYSPDGIVSEEEVAEAKCLSSALHLYVYFEKDIPPEYHRQNLQAFIANEKLRTLHFVCYDPRIPCLPLHYITVTREELADEIEKHKAYQLQVLKMLEEDVISISF